MARARKKPARAAASGKAAAGEPPPSEPGPAAALLETTSTAALAATAELSARPLPGLAAAAETIPAIEPIEPAPVVTGRKTRSKAAAEAMIAEAEMPPQLQQEVILMTDDQAELGHVIETQVENARAIEAKATETSVATLQGVQEKMRSLVEKGLAESRANYAKAKTSANEAASAFEASFDAAKTGAISLHAKAIDAIKAQADAQFEFAKACVAVKSLTDYVTLQTEFARKQVEAMTANSREMSELAQKVANDATSPIQAQFIRTFKVAV